jgi:Leucine-rich repeat (LRR) protein
VFSENNPRFFFLKERFIIKMSHQQQQTTRRSPSPSPTLQKSESTSPSSPNKKNTQIFSRLYADDPELTTLDLSGAFLVVESGGEESFSPSSTSGGGGGAGDTALSPISDALHCTTYLQELNLSNNGITDIGAALLADALASETAAKGLTTVILDGNAIGTQGVLAIVAA